MMPVILPPWVHAVGPEEIKSADRFSHIGTDRGNENRFDEWESFSAAAGWENIYVSSVANEQEPISGRENVVQIVEAWGVRPFSCNSLILRKILLSEWYFS